MAEVTDRNFAIQIMNRMDSNLDRARISPKITSQITGPLVNSDRLTSKDIYSIFVKYIKAVNNGLSNYQEYVRKGKFFAPDPGDEEAEAQFRNNIKAVQFSQECFRYLLTIKPVQKLKKNQKLTNQDKGKMINALDHAKNFFMTYFDTLNPTYNDYHYGLDILKTPYKDIYTDKLFGYTQDQSLIKYNEKKLKRNQNDSDEDNQKHQDKDKKTIAHLSGLPKKEVDKIVQAMNDSKKLKSSINSAKNYWHKVINKLLKKYQIPTNIPYKVVTNPMSVNANNLQRVVTIEGIKFYYNPKEVSLYEILNMNIPFLPADQDQYDVTRDITGTVAED